MIKIVAAVTLDRVMGIQTSSKDCGKLPWTREEAKGDLEYFKDLTKNHSIIMGRKTFESINKRPLPERKNFVISSKSGQGCLDEYFTECSVGDAIDVSSSLWPSKDIWIIGGSQIFAEGFKFANEIWLTIIPIKAYEKYETKHLVYFPDIPNNFVRTTAELHPINPNLLLMQYKRKK